MVRTEYSWMSSEELAEVALNRKTATALEVELAQRLAFYLDEFKKDVTWQPPKAESRTP